MMEGVLHLHDTATACKSRKAAGDLKDCGIEEVNHSLYCPSAVIIFSSKTRRNSCMDISYSVMNFNVLFTVVLMTKTEASLFQDFPSFGWNELKE